MTKQDSQENITTQQEVAVEALASGANVTQAAEAAQVARQTVSGWLRQEAFRTLLRERRELIWHDAVERLRALTGRALNVLEQALDGTSPQAVAAAKAVLQTSGLAMACEDKIRPTEWITKPVKEWRAATPQDLALMNMVKQAVGEQPLDEHETWLVGETTQKKRVR
jgi:hypothetical protein